MGKQIVQVELKTSYITLGQLLKCKGIIRIGSEAKNFLINNQVFVNGELENRRGRKLYGGDAVSIGNFIYSIK